SAEPDDGWRPWLHERCLATLGAALLDAIQMTCPEVDASDLRCDIDLRPGGIGEVRISEDQPGGTGVVEAFVDRYVDDPRSFWASVTAALGPGDGERVDVNVRHFLASADD